MINQSAPRAAIPALGQVSLPSVRGQPADRPCELKQPRSNALQGKSYLCIPFLGIARLQSQFPESCVCERFICSQDRSTYLPASEGISRPILEIYKYLTDV
jgi:hypothetical protein